MKLNNLTKQKIRLLAYFFAGGFFLFLDQLLKFAFRKDVFSDIYFWNKFLGFEYYKNYGIAFSLPVTSFVSISLSILAFLFFLYFIFLERDKKIRKFFWNNLDVFIIIFFGALSNFFDRVLFSFVIDYIRVYTSVFNIGDIMVVLGAMVLFYRVWRNRE